MSTAVRNAMLREQQDAARLDAAIEFNLRELGYGGEWLVTDFADVIDFQEGPGILAVPAHRAFLQRTSTSTAFHSFDFPD